MSTLEELRTKLNGSLVTPSDDAYEESRRVYNGMIDRRPAAIAVCTATDDVAAVVDYARDSGTELSVRGGAHSVPGFGTADGAIVADLSGMRAVRVDPDARLVYAEGGATLGDVNTATGAHGLATPGGVVSTTGVGGLTLGGGIGYLSRAYGLSVDNLESARVVTADGQVRIASADENPDLYWALRGGGGNFGVVTEFRLRCHPVGTVVGGPMFFEMSDGRAIFEHYRKVIGEAPREYSCFPAFQQAPPLPFLPEDRVGEPLVAVVHCWAGETAEGEEIIESFRQVAQPVGEFVGEIPLADLNALFDPLLPAGLQHYWKAAFVTDLSDAAIDAHFAHGPNVPAMQSTMHLYPINGASQDVPADATAFGHREASFAAVIAGMWPDAADNEANIAWVKDYYDAIAPHSEAGGYINFTSGDDQVRAPENYGANYERLREVKRAYDPDNLFHLNQNIVP